MHIVELVLPIFAVIVTGWLARTSGYMPRELAPLLMQFAYYIAMPALVFVTIAREPFRELLDGRFLIAFGGGSLLCFIALIALFRLGWHKSLGASAILGSTAAMTNTGFVALPLLRVLYGQEGVLAAAIATVFVGVILFPALVILLEMNKRERHVDMGPLVKQVVMNPVLLSALLGLVVSLSGFRLPAPVLMYLNIMGDALTPCALFAIGCGISFSGWRKHVRLYTVLCVMKLLLTPLVVYGLCVLLELGRVDTIAAVICAAVPTAKSAYVLASVYQVEEEAAGAVISLTTLFSIVTLLGWLYVLN